MEPKTAPTPPLSSLDALRCRVDEWRRTRKKRTRMPEGLWEAATELARVEGVHRVARRARLDYYALKSRVEAKGRKETLPAFVEVAFPRPEPLPPCVVDMERPDGARMRIQMAEARGLAELTRVFWSQP